MLSRRGVLFVASFLMLYFELALIRWVPGHVRVLAYFTNFVLIACFFGMGLGMTLSGSRFNLGRWAPAGVALLVVLTFLLRGLWVGSQGNVFIFLEYEGLSHGQIAMYPMLVVSYLVIAAAFVPFGQLIGRSFGTPAALPDYSINLLGSMAGIVVFFAYSWLELPPWVWFLFGMPLLALLVPTRGQRGLALGLGVAVVALVWFTDRGTIWSPYHKIEMTPFGYDKTTKAWEVYGHESKDAEYLPPEFGTILRINDNFYQSPVNLTDAAVARYPILSELRAHYDLPFKLKPNARRVLVVGAGTGNDVAAALRSGAQHVDVVDIDPTIVELGKKYHPEKPYDQTDRVTIHIDDARHFFHHAEPGYDVIVFALIDSHRLLGTLSSLRLDSYVFTVESFEEARRLLGPDGVQVTAFAIQEPWTESRFYEMLRQAYGEEPIVASEQHQKTHGIVLISGPGSRHLGFTAKPRPVDATALLTTDDWPFIYALNRSIPAEYLSALFLVLSLSVLSLYVCTGQRGLPDLHFFCLGAGFLLLETKNVTTLALVFGSTWYVNSVVFFAILVMALLANALVSLVGRVPVWLAYAGLFGAIALNFVLPLQGFAGANLLVRLLVVGGVTALPVFFSGLIFSDSFRQTVDPAHALGSNILGGVLGGVTEYLSMIFGLRFLFVLIAAFYALSLLALRRGVGTTSDAPAAAVPVGSAAD